MKTRVSVSSILLFGILPVAADPVLECNSGMATTAEITACLAETEERVDRALDTALDFAMAVAGDVDEMTGNAVSMAALDEAQAAWRAFRDAHCAFVSASFGDPDVGRMEAGACRVQLGRARVADLLDAMR